MELLKKLLKAGIVAITAAAATLVVALFPGHRTYIQTAQASTATNFISQYKSDVQKASSKYNLYASVMMGQAALESGWGQSTLTTQANNFFGIKGAYNGQSVSMPTTEYNSNGQLENTTANFKKYPSAYASFADNGATLRNGTSWNTKYYSGTWKENASSYVDAANALTGKYATAPDYGGSIIKIIQTYGIDKLFGEAADSTSTSSSTTSASATSSSSSSSATSSSPVLTSVSYYRGSGDQTVPLAKKYQHYYVYNHVKGASKQEKRYSWKSLGVRSRVNVYLDMRGVKKGTAGNWYRIRFYPNTKAKRFWVYSDALSFSPIYSGTTDGTLVANKRTSGTIYSRVLGSSLLAKKVGKVSSLKQGTKYKVDKTALIHNSKSLGVWYHIASGKTKGWISNVNVLSAPASVAKVDFKGQKAISSAAKANYLYTDFNKAGQFTKHLKLAQVRLTIGSKVTVDKLGYRLSDKSIWYRITCPGSSDKYWVSSKFLSWFS